MATPVTGYLSRISGPRRSPRYEYHLACLLIFVAGMLNSAGFVAVALYTSHMTGLTATMADHLVDRDVELLSLGAVGLGAFVLGGVWCSMLYTWGRRRGLGSRFANVLAFEGVLILGFSLTAEAVEGEHHDLVHVAVLCFTMGMQNALITKVADVPVRTTHVTGMVTDIAIELGKALYPHRTPGPDPVRGDRRKLQVLTSLVGLFFLGGVTGTVGYLAAGFLFLVPVALLLLVLAYRPVARDLSPRRPPARVFL
ncbi:YoaK family protein [Kocuria sp. KH4]